jgi:hypothetical protein
MLLLPFTQSNNNIAAARICEMGERAELLNLPLLQFVSYYINMSQKNTANVGTSYCRK